MANKMLIDASHQEETRVVVVRGNRVEEFDFESEHKKQLKGNIYLAKVTRVEPSLQAAFIEYGGNRHGFLAFSEIHPDYYQIPKADRQALIEEDLLRAKEEEEENDRHAAKAGERQAASARAAKRRDAEDDSVSEPVDGSDGENQTADGENESDGGDEASAPRRARRKRRGETSDSGDEDTASDEETDGDSSDEAEDHGEHGGADREVDGDEDRATRARSSNGRRSRRSRGGRRRSSEDGDQNGDHGGGHGDRSEDIDQIGSEDAMEEVPVRQSRPRRQYKIQEVIKRRQILLVQVVKEERGNKGAALTTYLSLAGRYSVLMPNTARGGGISRKITNAADRKRLKDVVRDLDVPRGMGIILRTAGANRTKPEVKRDYEYLMRLWETVRTVTLSSIAPSLVYEEGSLIKRSIRDLYNKDIDQILVSGETGYREAKDFMRMLMPSQAKVVQPYRDPTPIFARQGMESQLEKLVQPHVTLKSGGYIIINQTEALVAIDVNSGRSTREHSIEDTAYQTNMEAAEEVARQLRLRDLAGLIVIDFIDMEEKRNNRNVEKKIKDCLKSDRARIQVGSISHFGLLEMSRQRIRASVLESTMQPCAVCEGTGYIRSPSSSALHVLRTIEEHLQKQDSHDLIVKVQTATALYVLNEKRSRIEELERHHSLRIVIEADESVGHHNVTVEHGAEAVKREVDPDTLRAPSLAAVDALDEAADEEAARRSENEIEEALENENNSRGRTEAMSDDEVGRGDAGRGDAGRDEGRDDGEAGGKRRRRRRRRGGGRDDAPNGVDAASDDGDEDATDEASDAVGDIRENRPADNDGDSDGDNDRGPRRRRRGRRGGRRNRDENGNETNGDDRGSSGGEQRRIAAHVHGDDGEPVSVTVEDGETRVASDTEGSVHAQTVVEVPVEASQGKASNAGSHDPRTPLTVAAEVGELALSPVETAGKRDGIAHAVDVVLEPEAARDDHLSDPHDAGQDESGVAANDDMPTPAAAPMSREPVLTSSGNEGEEEKTAKPRRTGWWNRVF